MSDQVLPRPTLPSPHLSKQPSSPTHHITDSQSIPSLLPPNQQVYISSIITNSFSNNQFLISYQNDTTITNKMRKILVQYYLQLNAHQYVFYSAFFYLQKYAQLKKGEQEENFRIPLACLALARKYQKGKEANLDAWKEKLGIKFQNQSIRALQDQIIQTLDFSLEPVTRFNFMSDLFLIINLSEKNQHFCSYLLDLSLFLTDTQTPQNAFQFTQAEIGLSVVRLACHFFHPSQIDKLPIQKLNFNSQRIHQCCSQIFQLLLNRKLKILRHIRHRYKRSKFMQVSKIQFFKIRRTGSDKDVDTADENENENKKNKENQQVYNQQVHNQLVQDLQRA